MNNMKASVNNSLLWTAVTFAACAGMGAFMYFITDEEAETTAIPSLRRGESLQVSQSHGSAPLSLCPLTGIAAALTVDS
jgi:hypothetical protein